jgi:hypothetical protein
MRLIFTMMNITSPFGLTFGWLHPSFHIRTLRALLWSANILMNFPHLVPALFMLWVGPQFVVIV